MLDEDVDPAQEGMLRQRGFDVVSVWGLKRRGLSDEAQLTFAAQEGRVFITHNRVHFDQLAVDWWGAGKHHAGIICARRRVHMELFSRLASELKFRTPEEFIDLLVYA
jgi:hypothetical protein